MQQIVVGNDGSKAYRNIEVGKSVLGVPLPTKATRESGGRDPSKAQYPFNTWQIGEFILVADEAEKTRYVAAFSSAQYAPARAKGRLVTRNIAKYTKEQQDEIFNGHRTGYGIWFVEKEKEVEETPADTGPKLVKAADAKKQK